LISDMGRSGRDGYNCGWILTSKSLITSPGIEK
jgi:hypothetical protein